MFMNKLFEDVFNSDRITPKRIKPTTTIETDDSNYYLELLVPGIEPDTLNITTEENLLIVHGECKNTKAKQLHGKLKETFTLPLQIDQNNIQANYKHGILTLTLPKKQTQKQININMLTE